MRLIPQSHAAHDETQAEHPLTTCPWKGEAHYYSLLVNGDMLPDAVWFYPEPKADAHLVQGRVAFWKGVKVEA